MVQFVTSRATYGETPLKYLANNYGTATTYIEISQMISRHGQSVQATTESDL